MDEAARDIGRELLAWYRAVGVDEAVGEAATDWLARGDVPPGHGFDLASAPKAQTSPATSALPGSAPEQRPARVAPPAPAAAPPRAPAAAPGAAPPAARAFPTTPPDQATMAARTAAREARSLEELEATLRAFDGCGLTATAKSLCFYRGTPQAPLMLIGEAPGRDEDLAGKPFVGPAGKLLDKMLAAIGLGEADVHITNAVYWRPPGNRTPSLQELQVCRPFLERQIELAEPAFIVALGGAAAKHLLGIDEGIMRLRGRWRDVELAGRTRKVYATLHPAYLLRTPAQKRLAWRDLLAIEQALEER